MLFRLTTFASAACALALSTTLALAGRARPAIAQDVRGRRAGRSQKPVVRNRRGHDA